MTRANKSRIETQRNLVAAAEWADDVWHRVQGKRAKARDLDAAMSILCGALDDVYRGEPHKFKGAPSVCASPPSRRTARGTKEKTR